MPHTDIVHEPLDILRCSDGIAMTKNEHVPKVRITKQNDLGEEIIRNNIGDQAFLQLFAVSSLPRTTEPRLECPVNKVGSQSFSGQTFVCVCVVRRHNALNDANILSGQGHY